MLSFDKIKIITDIKNISIINEAAFEKKARGDELISLQYEVSFPYKLFLKVSYADNELVIEFTGKILGQNYQKLISLETIEECFKNINDIGICTLSIDKIMNNAKVVSCDVTKDIKCNDISRFTRYLNGNIKNRKKYVCRLKNNGNFIIEKNVDSPICKRRLTIYDKNKEMNLAKNMQYRNRYDIPAGAFQEKCRLEMNLSSKAQIRSALKIDNTELMTVLSSSADPITSFLDEVLAETTDNKVSPSNKKEYEAMLVLKDCDYDLNNVEAKLRMLSGRSFHLQRDMEIYRELLNKGVTDDGYTKQKVLNIVNGVSN